jgi:hypothetical protein
MDMFLILCGMVIMAMVALVFMAMKMTSNLNRREENGTLYLDRAAEGLRAGDGDASAGVWAGEGDQLAVPEMAKCKYCDSAAWVEGPWRSEKCERHNELSAVIGRLERIERPATFENIMLTLALTQNTLLSHRPAEVRILLNQMQVVS